MRFLNTTTLQFEEVPDSEIELEENQYAILSHRWGADKDEVTYEDMISSADVSNKKGYAKIKAFCNLASAANCQYGWVDTCCINKGNSSELSEAINSMYLWYRSSTVCFAYLEDVPQKKFEDSEWFDRGWTLQELIAPKVVVFFDEQWTSLGTKAEFLAELSRKTRIPKDILNHTAKPSSCSVAQRMSWAASRITKRIEDRAYSLMGLFEINMPMIYGEREKAFLRFQQEITRKSKDESIFAWDMGLPDDTTKTYTGLYAPSPSAYRNCGDIVELSGSQGFSISNGEHSIMLKCYLTSRPRTYLAVLHCAKRGSINRAMAIVIADTSNTGEYVRIRDNTNISLTVVNNGTGAQQIRVSIDPKEPPLNFFFGFWLRTLQPPGHTESEITVLSNSQPHEADFICQKNYWAGNTGIIRLNPKNELDPSSKWSTIRWIKFGFSHEWHPIIWLANDSQSKSLDEPFERAIASEGSTKTQAHEKIMKADPLRLCRAVAAKELLYEWPEGRLIVKVDRDTGLTDFVIDELSLKISIKPLPFRSPTTALSASVDGSGLPLKPMMVWTVDITETEGKAEMKSEVKYPSGWIFDGSFRHWCPTIGLYVVCPFSLCNDCLDHKCVHIEWRNFPRVKIQHYDSALAIMLSPCDRELQARLKYEADLRVARHNYGRGAESRILSLNTK